MHTTTDDRGRPRAEATPEPARTFDARTVAFGVAAVAFVSRLLTRARVPTEWDSVQLVLGLDRFDVRVGSPHPPGYWGYVALGRAVRELPTLDGTTAMWLLAAVASSATAALTYLVGRSMHSDWLGLAAAAVVVTSAFDWFYGSIVNTYSFEALTAILLVVLALRAAPGGTEGVLAALVLGLGAAFRQTLLALLGPLALFVAIRSNRDDVRRWALTLAIGAAAIAVWAVPTVLEQPGGLDVVREANSEHFRATGERTSIFYGGWREEVADNLGTTSAYVLVALGHLVPVALAAIVLRFGGTGTTTSRGRAGPGMPSSRIVWSILGLAIAPTIAFITLFHFGKAGYVLSIIPTTALLVLWPARDLRSWRRITVTAILAVACIVPAHRFLRADALLPTDRLDDLWIARTEYGAPFPFTASQIDQVDRQTDADARIRDFFDPSRDVLVHLASNGGAQFRHTTFSLPEFTVHFHDGGDAITARDGIYERERDRVIEVPPGGRAVLLVATPTAELLALESEGLAELVRLEGGANVWVVQPGAVIEGVTITEVPGALDAELDPARGTPY